MALRERLREVYGQWLRRRIPPARQITLNQRRIFILPSRYGYLYLIITVSLFIGGINYENNLIMGLSFLLTSLFVTAILHTYRNLSGLTLRAGASRSGFAGGTGALEVVLSAGDRHAHRSLWLRWPQGHQREISVEQGEEESLWLGIPLPRRGRVFPGRLRVVTRYPLGLLRAWSLVDLDHGCLAWPQPLPGGTCPAGGGEKEQGRQARGQGSEDFHGLRAYVEGDSLRFVDWKAYARGRGLNTKQFADPAAGRRWLEWQRLEGMAVEQRLGRLAFWVLELDRAGDPYGLRLPDGDTPPATGADHRRHLLDRLALYGSGEAS